MSNGPTAIPVSPVNDMVAALNAALASHARLPEVEQTLFLEQGKTSQLSQHNQRLEENIIGYKNSIRELTEKVRSLEVERDDYGFRHMEAEDKLTKLNSLVADLAGHLRATADDCDLERNKIIPPKPVPNVAEAPKVDEVKGSSEGGPTANSNQIIPSASVPSNPVEAAQSVNSMQAPTSEAYQPFTPPTPTAKPVEITEGSQSNERPSTGPSSTNEPYPYWNSPAPGSYR